MQKQKDVFLDSEGDAWLSRNKQSVIASFSEDDDLFTKVISLGLPKGSRVLEIGCGFPARLAALQSHGLWCSGIDPSTKAVAECKKMGIEAHVGTAENLPFCDSSFDLVVFGFCLYLCDRPDLFKIAFEADRVLTNPGWLLIHDFYSWDYKRVPYSHKEGIYTHKADNTKMFSWHPHYTTFYQEIEHHKKHTYTDNAEEWTALSVLRKCTNE